MGETEHQAAKIRASGVLGRSAAMSQLFDLFVASPGVQLRESDIAVAMFGSGVHFDASQDARVRVYVHRLRKKLDDYYAGEGAGEPVRLLLPRGEYCLEVRSATDGATPAGISALVRARYRALGLGAALLAVNVLVWAVFWVATPHDGLSRVRERAPWSGLRTGERPIAIVVGDYYIFGEADASSGAGRLVREYGINSREDLDEYLMQHPEYMEKYYDLNLHYLPLASAFALRTVLPIVAGGSRRNIRIVPSSDLTPAIMKESDLVYIGYISGLGLLREPVFGGSRFAVGDTYDELIDHTDQRHYFSSAGGPSYIAGNQRDYGFVSTFEGPVGNRFIIIAGMRDIGLMQAAEALSDVDVLRAMSRQAKGAKSFEALLEVQGVGRSSMGGRLLVASELDASGIWRQNNRRFEFPS